jgi:hypothetical protein
MPRVKPHLLLVPPFRPSALHLAAGTARVAGDIDVVPPNGSS